MEQFGELALVPFFSDEKGALLILMKEFKRGEIEAAIAEAKVEKATKTQKELLEAKEAATKFMIDIGRKYAAFYLGSYSNNQTNVACCYGKRVELDYADPRFFDHLDRLVQHIKTHDDILQFSLQD